VSRFITSALIQVLALTFMNKLLPRTNVNWGAAILGGVVTAFLLEMVKLGFVTFAVRIMLKSYSSVYGPLGLVPLVLVWIYTSWLLVLLGAEIAHALQNLRLLEAEDRRRRDDEPINGLLAAQLLAAVAATHEVGGAGYPKEQLVTEFGLTPDNVERVVARLKQRGLIGEVRGDINGYIPARPAASIRLEEVLSAFRSSDIELAHGATSPVFAKLVGELEEGRRRRIAGVTIAELMPLQETPRDEDTAAVPQVVRPDQKKG
jgi:membrane protein